VARSGSIWSLVHRFRLVLIWTIAGGAFFVSLWILRNSPYQADPLLDTYLQMAGSLIGFTFAANALVPSVGRTTGFLSSSRSASSWRASSKPARA
jgi:hypothetical protein